MQTEFSPTSAQTSLGQRLRSQRLALHMSIEEISAQLKLPTTIIDAMEGDDHNALGAVIFARGRLGNYARLVGVPIAAVDAQFANASVAPPPLVGTGRGSRLERSLHRVTRQGIYAVLTAAIVLPVIWLATHHQLPQAASSLTALDAPPAGMHKPSDTDANASAGEARNQPPVVASIAPFGGYHWANQIDGSSIEQRATNGSAASVHAAAANQRVPDTRLELRFSGDSWVDIIGMDGRVIEHGTVEAGSVRNYRTAAVGGVTIGNPGSVLILRNGEPLDLKAFQNANTTRFTLSSDGKPAPVRD